MQKQPKFHDCLCEWYSLNAALILNHSLPAADRIQLLINRRFYSELFNTMDGVIYDELNK